MPRTLCNGNLGSMQLGGLIHGRARRCRCWRADLRGVSVPIA
jgi:hypothetical protein